MPRGCLSVLDETALAFPLLQRGADSGFRVSISVLLEPGQNLHAVFLRDFIRRAAEGFWMLFAVPADGGGFQAVTVRVQKLPYNGRNDARAVRVGDENILPIYGFIAFCDFQRVRARRFTSFSTLPVREAYTSFIGISPYPYFAFSSA